MSEVLVIQRLLYLPEGILVTDGNSREDDTFIVNDLDIHRHRPAQVVLYACGHLKEEDAGASKKQQ